MQIFFSTKVLYVLVFNFLAYFRELCFQDMEHSQAVSSISEYLHFAEYEGIMWYLSVSTRPENNRTLEDMPYSCGY